jgi:hypothetical protein
MKTLYSLVCILFLSQSLSAQSKETPWARWNFLLGDWVGEGSGQPGEGSGYFSLKPDLDGKILVRKNHSEYPATQNNPATIHDDLMFIYSDSPGTPARAIYFDNEGHTIYYTIHFSDRDESIVMTSEIHEKAPRFRLTYQPLESKLKIKFEIAPPGKPEAFSTYLDGMAVRKK